jgi:hypothetical protein
MSIKLKLRRDEGEETKIYWHVSSLQQYQYCKLTTIPILYNNNRDRDRGGSEL